MLAAPVKREVGPEEEGLGSLLVFIWLSSCLEVGETYVALPLGAGVPITATEELLPGETPVGVPTGPVMVE